MQQSQKVPEESQDSGTRQLVSFTFSLALHFLAEQICKGPVKGLLRLQIKVLVVFLPNNYSVRSFSLLVHHTYIKNVATVCPAQDVMLSSFASVSPKQPPD